MTRWLRTARRRLAGMWRVESRAGDDEIVFRAFARNLVHVLAHAERRDPVKEGGPQCD